MEVSRNELPKKDYLEKVRDLADENEIILIFDECTSGFRETFGGLHKKYGVEPDLVIYGKTLGNGYGITAVVGKKSVMEVSQNTFISSTFWTERIGPSAALATLDEMKKVQSWKKITSIGNKVRNGWLRLAENHNLNIEVMGIPAISTYSFKSKKNLKYKTYITQEMLKKGFLASTNFYACTEHKEEHIKSYLSALDEIYNIISKSENDKLYIDDFLDGPVCHSGFERLN